jgi:hypothetical protein
MKTRLFVLLLVFVAALGILPAVSAQGTTQCFNLSADDCAIVTAAEANSANINSFNMNVNFTLNADLSALSALDPTTPSKVNVTLQGTGAFSKVTGGKIPFSVMGDFKLHVDAGQGAQDIPLSFVIANDNIYYKDPTDGSWKGMTADSLSTMLSANPMTSMMSGAMTSSASGGTAATDATAALAAAGLKPEDLAAIMSVPGFIDYQRLPDDSGLQNFALKIDLIKLLTSPEFSKMMQSMMTAASTSNPSAAQSMQMMQMLPMLLQNATLNFTFTQSIGSDDKFLHKFALDGKLNLDLNQLMSAMGGSTGGSTTPTMGPVTADLHFDISLNDINSAVNITAPEGATMVTPSS